jgi:hypothetical protein
MKFKEWVKDVKKRLKSYISKKWGSLREDTQQSIVKNFITLTNYLINASLISIPVFFFTLIFYKFSILRYLLIVISFWIILPIFEHYYVWLREDWKREIKP